MFHAPSSRRDHLHLAGLLIALAACAALAFLPAGWLARPRSAAGSLLAPAQRGVTRLRGACRTASRWLHGCTANGSRWVELDDRCRRLEDENQRLKSALAAVPASPLASGQDAPDDLRLLRAKWVEAHVLGQQALAFLGRQQLLDVGAADVQPQALVAVGVSAWLDAGRDRGLASGQLALAAGCVWGRIVEVGAATSVLRSVWHPAYRDVVRLVSPGGDPRHGPQGLLEGRERREGEGREGGRQDLPRIRLVEVSQPVAVGDVVYTADEGGVLPQPLRYGRVARLERPAGAAHWEIWMQPAVEPEPPERVAVLRIEFNPARRAKEAAP